LNSSAGGGVFSRLIKDADILIEDKPPGKTERLGLGFETLQKVDPALIVASFSPFG